ncbi:MAG: hypothetical protein NTV22_05365 [bacterium]|nr:hypothetical protein [bacterium]
MKRHGADGNWYNDNMVMKKLRIYLDTSVINFLFADDAPEKRDITREFFAERLVRHMANVERQKKINQVNSECGYKKQLLLVTPMEVLDEGENE